MNRARQRLTGEVVSPAAAVAMSRMELAEAAAAQAKAKLELAAAETAAAAARADLIEVEVAEVEAAEASSSSAACVGETTPGSGTRHVVRGADGAFHSVVSQARAVDSARRRLSGKPAEPWTPHQKDVVRV